MADDSNDVQGRSGTTGCSTAHQYERTNGDRLREALYDLNDGELNNGCKLIRKVLRDLGEREPDLLY